MGREQAKVNASDRQLRRVTRVASKEGQDPYVKNPRLRRGIVIGGCALSFTQRGANRIHTFCTDKKYDKKLAAQSVIKARLGRTFL